MILIKIIAVVGFLLSLYSYYVEQKSKSKNYHAVCDINEKISCTKAFKSGYGKIFGIENSVLGMTFYPVIYVLALFNQINYIFYFSILSFLGTIYLSYVLYFKVKSACVVCTSIYLVNIMLFVAVLLEF